MTPRKTQHCEQCEAAEMRAVEARLRAEHAESLHTPAALNERRALYALRDELQAEIEVLRGQLLVSEAKREALAWKLDAAIRTMADGDCPPGVARKMLDDMWSKHQES